MGQMCNISILSLFIVKLGKMAKFAAANAHPKGSFQKVNFPESLEIL